jgi:two-component system NtrC family sensor kinase
LGQARRHFPRWGLAAKLASGLIAGSLAFFGLFSYMHQRLEKQHLEALVSLSAERIGDIIRSSAWQHMMKNDRESLFVQIRNIGREPGIRRLRIFNENGLISHSTENAEIGHMVDKQAEACYGCHAQQAPLAKLKQRERTRVFLDAQGRRTMGAILPIENQPECSNASCHVHPASRRILGVIDVHLSLDAVDAQLAEHRSQLALFVVVGAVLLMGFSALFVWLVLHRPLHQLTEGTAVLASGDLSYRIPVQSGDEVGELAASFNRMAQELDEAHGELTEWNRTLEDRVRQKTEEIERLYKGLITTEKMASLGRLAATVAHEVNNPLFGMLTYARLTMKDLAKVQAEDPIRARMLENLRVIERESRRCGDLMKNLLAFARQTPPQRSPIEVNKIVARAIDLVRHQLDLAEIRLDVELADGLPEISCDAAQIQQVLIVLLVNASEAIVRNGWIRIKTGPCPTCGGVCISVKDSASGIPTELQDKIFEPFFSTKENQHRTGLGLAIAKGIVDRHGGALLLKSPAGEGAEFIVQLPLVAPLLDAQPVKVEAV